MIRKFAFAAEINRTLDLIPLAVRRKFHRAGLKDSLDQWQVLERDERLAICHLPVDSSEELEAFDLFVREAVRRRRGEEPSPLSDEKRAIAEPPAVPPEQLVARARAQGFTLDPTEWERLDADQRYALVKLGGGNRESHDLPAALAEFLGAR